VAITVLLIAPGAQALTTTADTNIGTAVSDWTIGPTAAAAMNGNIFDWSTVVVTSMASVFTDEPTFSGETSKWNAASVANVLSTHPMPSSSTPEPQGLAADVQVPCCLCCLEPEHLVGLRYRMYAPPEAGGAPTVVAVEETVGAACATFRSSTAACASACVRADEAQTF
jgi:hypothetical protein